jgi:hypothetical protein
MQLGGHLKAYDVVLIGLRYFCWKGFGGRELRGVFFVKMGRGSPADDLPRRFVDGINGIYRIADQEKVQDRLRV